MTKQKNHGPYAIKEILILASSISLFILLRIVFFEGIIMSGLMSVLGIIKILRKK